MNEDDTRVDGSNSPTVRATAASVRVESANFRRERLNVAQSATIAGVHRNTIYNWVKENRVEYVRTPTGVLRIFADTLLRSPEAD